MLPGHAGKDAIDPASSVSTASPLLLWCQSLGQESHISTSGTVLVSQKMARSDSGKTPEAHMMLPHCGDSCGISFWVLAAAPLRS